MTFPDVTTRCGHLKINGKGKPIPVADAKCLVEIVWLLPGKKAHTFRRQSSEKVCRLLGGDMTLVSEIDARHAALQRTEEGRATQEFMLDGREEAVETFDGMPDGFSYLSKEDRTLFVKEMIEQKLEAGKQKLQLVDQQLHELKVALKRKRVEDLVEGYRSLQDLGVHLDCRTLIELRDNVAIPNRQDVAANGSMALATPLIEDSTTPTHELDAEHRGAPRKRDGHRSCFEQNRHKGSSKQHVGCSRKTDLCLSLSLSLSPSLPLSQAPRMHVLRDKLHNHPALCHDIHEKPSTCFSTNAIVFFKPSGLLTLL